MVARFDTNHSLRNTLNYNEQKVKRGVAELLSAKNYPLQPDRLTFYQKLARLENQAALNENVRRNAIHISLNFDPSERPDKERLVAIADDYMQQTGLADLPYLVYQHHDAGHPHIHIVSVKVHADGRRVDTQNIGRNQSETARKAIEIKYGLVKSETALRGQAAALKAVHAQRVQYGKMETRQAISNVLKAVIGVYKYSSLPELNAVLRGYNVVADRGTEGSKMFQNNGLYYRVLDGQGNRIGTPVKASLFYSKPTLKNLEKQFAHNDPLKQRHKTRVKNMIDLSLLRNEQLSLPALIKALEREGVATVLRQSDTGKIYGITYVDHVNKVVFNGSDLGKAYSAKGLQERCSNQELQEQPQIGQTRHASLNKTTALVSGTDWADTLLRQEFTGDTLPYELRKNRKRKRRGPSNNL